jgi:hypothetical protein
VGARRGAVRVRRRQGAPLLGDERPRAPPHQQLGARRIALRRRDRAALPRA